MGLPGRPLARLTLVLLLSNTADQFTLLALLWYVLRHSGSATVLGLLVACNAAPALATAPWVGSLLDRRRPQTLIAVDNAARGVCLLLVPVLDGMHLPPVPIALAVAAVSGTLAPITYTGTRVLLPRLATPGGLAAANARLSVGDQLPYLLGPATAGLAVARLGGAVSLVIPAAALIGAGTLVLGVQTQAPADPVRRDPGPNGLALLWREPALRALLILTVTYYLAYGPLEPALPVYVSGRLHGDATLYGLMWAVFGAGALAGLPLVRPLSRLRPGLVNALGAVAWSLCIAPMALVDQPVLAGLLFFAGAFVWAPYTAIEMSVIQRLVPAGRHGAVIGARRALLVAASPAGAALGGAFTTRATAPYVIAASAAACAVAGIGSLCSRGLRAVPAEVVAGPAERPREEARRGT
jgi:Na+/melibiose symporter-like transporter